MPAHVAQSAAIEAREAAAHGARLVQILQPLDAELEPRALTEFRTALAQATEAFTAAARLLEDR